MWEAEGTCKAAGRSLSPVSGRVDVKLRGGQVQRCQGGRGTTFPAVAARTSGDTTLVLWGCPLWGEARGAGSRLGKGLEPEALGVTEGASLSALGLICILERALRLQTWSTRHRRARDGAPAAHRLRNG